MTRDGRPDALALREMLVEDRPRSSLLDPRALSEAARVERVRLCLARLWIDRGHRISLRGGSATATRAVMASGAAAGRLVWLVSRDGEGFVHCSARDMPKEAFEEAAEAHSRRRAVRAAWAQVLELRRAVLMGRARLSVTPADARRGGLGDLGAELLGGGERSGRRLALLSYLDERPLYALRAAQARLGATAAVPVRARSPRRASAAVSSPTGPSAARPGRGSGLGT